MKRSTLFFFFLFSTAAFRLAAQELNCQIQVLSPQIQGTTEKRIFETLQKSIFEFMNNTKWTNDVFSPEERINCQLVLTISEKLSTDEYKGSLQVHYDAQADCLNMQWTKWRDCCRLLRQHGQPTRPHGG